MKSLYFVERAMGKSSLTLAPCPFSLLERVGEVEKRGEIFLLSKKFRVMILFLLSCARPSLN